MRWREIASSTADVAGDGLGLAPEQLRCLAGGDLLAGTGQRSFDEGYAALAQLRGPTFSASGISQWSNR